jgi:hypothetical protein
MRSYKARSRVAIGVAHKRTPSLLIDMRAKHRSKFAAPSSLIVTAVGKLKNCSYGENKHTNILQGEKFCRFILVPFL